MAAPPLPPADTTTTTTPSPAPRAPAPKPPLITHPGRVLTVVLTVGLVITLGIWAISTSQTETGVGRNVATLPSAVQSVSPGPGELARPQDTITVDLRDDLTGVLIIEPVGRAAFEVPEDQTERVVPLGQLSFRTGKGQELEKFDPGVYRVTVLYWPQAKPRPDNPAAYKWEFRAGA